MLCTDAMEQCRKSLGGHGYLNCAGVGPQMLSVLPQATYEGDYVVLSIQVGTNLIGAVTQKMLKGKKSNPKTPLLQYIYDFDPNENHKPPSVDQIESEKLLENHDFLLALLKRRACFLHYSTAETFQEAVMQQGGKVGPGALDSVKIEFMRMNYAHAYVMYAESFKERLDLIQKTAPSCAEVLKPVFELFCLTVIDSGYDKSSGLGDFLTSGCLPANDRRLYSLIMKRTKALLAQMRPQAVPLVDAWNIPDFLLNSVLGRFDGRVYESLYEQCKREPLNAHDVSDGYYDHIQFILHPEREYEPAKVQKRGDETDVEARVGMTARSAKL